jgi:hypothetical protein
MCLATGSGESTLHRSFWATREERQRMLSACADLACSVGYIHEPILTPPLVVPEEGCYRLYSLLCNGELL